MSDLGPEGHCFWCGRRGRKSSEWEQEHHRAGWQRLCNRCARQRLDNPWNALYGMRKLGPADV